MGKFRSNGHDLLDELHSTLDDIQSRAQDRHDAVNSRLQELEAEKHALINVQQTVAVVKGNDQGVSK